MPPLRPSGLQPEPPVYIGDVVRGDHFFFSMRVPLVLIPQRYKSNGINVVRWVADSQPVSKRGTWATTGNGTVADNDTDNRIIYVNVGGRHGYRASNMEPSGVAEISWDYIQKATLKRPRYYTDDDDEVQINSKFPRIIPISFVQL